MCQKLEVPSPNKSFFFLLKKSATMFEDFLGANMLKAARTMKHACILGLQLFEIIHHDGQLGNRKSEHLGNRVT